jgi:hypothetical protein
MKDCVDAAWTGSLPRRSLNQHLPWGRVDHRSFSTEMHRTFKRARTKVTAPNLNHYGVLKKLLKLVLK